MVDAPSEAAQLWATLDTALPQGAYRMELRTTQPGATQIAWVGMEDDREVRYVAAPVGPSVGHTVRRRGE
jgi:hypothetical protein